MTSRLKKIGGGATVLGLLAMFAIGAYEGRILRSYKDPIGIWTACDGETLGIKPGMKFTNEQCDVMFLSGLERHERDMRRCLNEPDLIPTKTYVAFLSLTYNIGGGGWCKGSVPKLWNAGKGYEACDRLLAYNKAGGKVLRGLTRRRQDERKWCIDGLNEPVTVLYSNNIAPEDRDAVKFGSSGFYVELLQDELGIPVDGKFGPGTREAVRAFQLARGMDPDGTVGTETWRALMAPPPLPEAKPEVVAPVPEVVTPDPEVMEPKVVEVDEGRNWMPLIVLVIVVFVAFVAIVRR